MSVWSEILTTTPICIVLRYYSILEPITNADVALRTGMFDFWLKFVRIVPRQHYVILLLLIEDYL